MKFLNKIFFKGLFLVLPVTLTFYLLYWASSKVESLFGNILMVLIGHELYIPGAGIFLTVFVIFLFGLLSQYYVTAKLIRIFTNYLEKFPLVKMIYNPLKDLMGLIPGRSERLDNHQKVVLFELFPQVHVMGLVTRESLDELQGQHQSKTQKWVTVYVPFSYMLGGQTYLVPQDKLKPCAIPVEQALKLSVTAWIKAQNSQDSESGNLS
jgi:uncharacterized membrane protein